jgi:hypothetical protein
VLLLVGGVAGVGEDGAPLETDGVGTASKAATRLNL